MMMITFIFVALF